MGKPWPWRWVRYRTFLGPGWLEGGAEEPGLAGTLPPHCPSSSPFSPQPHAGPPPSLPSTSGLLEIEPSSICCRLSLIDAPKEGRAGQGGWHPFHSKETEAWEIKLVQGHISWEVSELLLAGSQGFGLQVQCSFDSTPSLPSFPLPSAALAPLCPHLHSFSFLFSLCLSELSSSRSLWRKGKEYHLRRKGRAGGKQGAGEWRSGSHTATPGGLTCTVVYANGAPWSCAVHGLGSRTQRPW